MTREEAKEILEKEKAYMLSHGGDRQANALDIAIKALEQEPNDDAISRSGITSKIEEWADGFENGEYFSGHSVADAIRVCSGMADELPSVMPLHKKGKWIKEYDNSALDGLYHCSVCGRKLWIHNEESVSDYPYCHCGAEMESEE